MAISVQCEGCSKQYRVKDELAGRTLTCKDCGEKLHVPYDDDDDYEEEEYEVERPRKRSSKGTTRSRKTSASSQADADDSMGSFDLSRLTLIGWLLALISIGVGIVAVGAGIALLDLERIYIKLTALIAILIMFAVFSAAKFVLGQMGIKVIKPAKG